MHFYTNVAQRGNKIYIKGYYGGKQYTDVVEYRPYLFRESNEPSKYKTINGRNVSRVDFPSISDARDYIKQFENVENAPIYGLTNFLYAYLYDNFPGPISFDVSQISILTIDIEVAADEGFPSIQDADKEITAITIRKNGHSVVFGCHPYRSKSSDVTYVMCRHEKDLLRRFLATWNSDDWAPDIVTGWNCQFFDIPYLVNRISRVLSPSDARDLSPWRILEEKTIMIMGREQQCYIPGGVAILDYLELYRKFSFKNMESYKLDHVAHVELGENKLDYSEYGSLLSLYKQNFELFIDYNVKDVELVDRLEGKLKFIELVITMAYEAKVLFNDTLATVRPWDITIHNHLLDQNIVIPQNEEHVLTNQIVGGYVKEPKPGGYEWVVSYDVASMYPSTITSKNMSPDTIITRQTLLNILNE